MTDAEIESLCTKHQALVYHVLGKVKNYPLRIRDDLISDGQYALLRAARSFDPSKGVAFVTYAHRAIFNSMLSRVRDTRESQPITEALGETLAAPESFALPCDLTGIHRVVVELVAIRARPIKRVAQFLRATEEVVHDILAEAAAFI